MKTVSDFIKGCDVIINDDSIRGFNNVKRTHKVLKYSVLYLVSKEKITLDDTIDKWKVYWSGYDLIDHYKVANAYLKKIGRPELNYSDDKFKRKMR